MPICDVCGGEFEELYDAGGLMLCKTCLMTEAASILVNDEIEPDLGDF